MRNHKLRLLALCKALGLFTLARWLTRHRLKILCYHGFALNDEALFRPKLFITPEVFRDRLALIERWGMKVLPLGEAVDRLYGGDLPPNSLVITIDDGFHSVSRVAAPELKRHAFPATVYVTTYHVKHATAVFRLVVQYMFWKTALDSIWVSGVPWHADAQLDLRDPVQRELACEACMVFGESADDEAKRVGLCEQLGELLHVPLADITDRRLLHLMTPDELRALASYGVDVQLHTHRHRFSASDSRDAQREIAQNRAELTACLPGPFNQFCYPSGAWEPQQWAWLDAAGVKSSTTCEPGLNSSQTPRHALRRFLDGENIHTLEFESALCGFADLLRRG